jgi:hypothetical protein
MATEIKIWEIEGKKISPVEDTSLAAQHLEDEFGELDNPSPRRPG